MVITILGKLVLCHTEYIITYKQSKWLKLKRLIKPSVNEDAEQFKHSYISDRNAKIVHLL